MRGICCAFCWSAQEGFVGSVLRYLLSGACQGIFRAARFPVGTLVVNLSGCFVIGLLSELAEARNALTDLSRAFLLIGVLGGYTTFSTLSNESLNLLRTGDVALGSLNMAIQVLGGLSLAWFGRITGHLIWR